MTRPTRGDAAARPASGSLTRGDAARNTRNHHWRRPVRGQAVAKRCSESPAEERGSKFSRVQTASGAMRKIADPLPSDGSDEDSERYDERVGCGAGDAFVESQCGTSPLRSGDRLESNGGTAGQPVPSRGRPRGGGVVMTPGRRPLPQPRTSGVTSPRCSGAVRETGVRRNGATAGGYNRGLGSHVAAPDASRRSSPYRSLPAELPNPEPQPAVAHILQPELSAGGPGTAATTPSGGRSPAAFNREKMDAEFDRRTIRSLQSALEESQRRLQELRRENVSVNGELAVEKLRACDLCQGYGRGVRGPAAVSNRNGGPRAKLKETPLNVALTRAQTCPIRSTCGMAFVNATHAVFSKNVSALAIPIVRQLELRPRAGLASGEGERGDGDVLQQKFLPDPVAVGSADGTPVFKSHAFGTGDKGAAPEARQEPRGWAPKNPLHLATRALMEGAALATHRCADPSTDSSPESWTAPFCEIVLRQEPAFAKSEPGEIENLCRLLGEDRGVATYVRQAHSKQLTDMKAQLTRSFSTVLGFGSSRVLAAFFMASSGVAQSELNFVIESLGIGGIGSEASLPQTYAAWAQQPTASFSKWRKLSVENLENIRAIAQKFTSEYMQGSGRAGKGTTTDMMLDKFEVQGPDLLCCTPDVRQVMCSWMGRGIVDGQVVGDTSLIVVARADAYMAAWLAQTCAAGKLNKKVSPHVYNLLLLPLVAEAAVSLLKEFRDAFLSKEAKGRRELWAPYNETTLERALGSVGHSQQSLVEKGQECEEYDQVRELLDKDDDMQHLTSTHKLDFYMGEWRVDTVHFWDSQDAADYCVLTADFVRKNICCWMGDVRDAFVGVLDQQSNEFVQLTVENGAFAMVAETVMT